MITFTRVSKGVYFHAPSKVEITAESGGEWMVKQCLDAGSTWISTVTSYNRARQVAIDYISRDGQQT